MLFSLKCSLPMPKETAERRLTSQQLNTSCSPYLFFFLLAVQKMLPLAKIEKCFLSYKWQNYSKQQRLAKTRQLFMQLFSRHPPTDQRAVVKDFCKMFLQVYSSVLDTASQMMSSISPFCKGIRHFFWIKQVAKKAADNAVISLQGKEFCEREKKSSNGSKGVNCVLI